MKTALLIAIIGLGGCSITGPGNVDERLAYAKHRVAWSRLAIEDYSIQSWYSCFCPPDHMRPVVIHVSGDSMTSVHDVETGEPVSTEPYPPADVYFTIDRLFDVIDSRLRNGFDYHPVLHYPRSIESHLPNTADSEFSHTVMEFNRID